MRSRRTSSETVIRSEHEGRNFALVKSWAPQPAQRHKLLVDNVTKLFGFDARMA